MEIGLMAIYIPTVPLPLRSAFYCFVSSRNKTLGAPWKVDRNSHVQFFPRGSRDFVEVARGVAHNPERPVCFFPAYFCEGSLIPLRQAGARIVFYRVMSDLTPDWDDVRQREKAAHPDLFVLVHTFGRIQDASEALSFASETGCIVLEDGAHVLKPDGGMGSRYTIVLFSPHKLLAVPPLSLLSVPALLADRIRNPYKTAWRKSDWIWLAKRLVQKGIVSLSGLGLKVKPRAGGFDGAEGDGPPAIHYSREISRLGSRLLLAQQQSLSEIARKRVDNFVFLAHSFERMANIEIPAPFKNWPKDMAPYAFPFFVGEDNVSQVFSALWRQGVPALTWPDLPPEVQARPEEYREANRWRRNLLLLPVHQSLSKGQLEWMAHVALSVLGEFR